MHKRTTGFTMLELLVTIAIVAILAAIAAPSMIQFVRDSRLRGLSGQMITDLQFARSEAIRRNRGVLVCAVAGCANPGSNWAGGWVVCVDVDNNATCDLSTATNPNPLRSRAALDSSVTLTGPAAAITFRPDGTQGTVGAVPQLLTLSGTWSAPASYVHSINNTGVIAVKKQ